MMTRPPVPPSDHVMTAPVRAALFVCILLSAACASAGTGQPAFLTPDGPPRNPFSPAVRLGNTLYLAGQLGTDSTGLVAGGITAETRQALQNISRLLERTGSSMDRVVKCTVFMADMGEWPAMNEVYSTFFDNGQYPARSAVGITSLALNARVEIECIAAVG